MTFVSEPITPIMESMDTARMARGGPGLPMRFVWRGTEYEVAQVLETWRELSPCHSGADERYVRKHWFKVVTSDNDTMRIYCERQPRTRQQRKKRWWLYSIATGKDSD